MLMVCKYTVLKSSGHLENKHLVILCSVFSDIVDV